MDEQKIDITNLSHKDILEYCQKAYFGNGVFRIEYGIVAKRLVTVIDGYVTVVQYDVENGLVKNELKDVVKIEDLGLVKGYLAVWIDDYFISTESGKAILLDLWDATKIEFMEN